MPRHTDMEPDTEPRSLLSLPLDAIGSTSPFTEVAAPKKARLYSEDELPIDEEEYQEAVEKLQEEYRNKKGKKSTNHSIIKNLMEKTKLRRHEWIRKDRPLILEILDKFPYLSTSRWVSLHNSFKNFILVGFNLFLDKTRIQSSYIL